MLLIRGALALRGPGRGLIPARRALSALTGGDLEVPEHALTTASPPPLGAPLLRRCELPVPVHRGPVQAWVESLRGYEETRLGLADLHPDVFSVAPRLDILHEVAIWQKNFKRISYAKTKTRAEDDLHVVDSLELPTSDPKYLSDLVRHRCWGDSVLLVDVNEEMPQNIVSAVSNLKTINLIPAVGLNVHSMLKHQTLVLTLNTVAFLEKKLLWHDKRYTALYPFCLPYSDFP